jgi:hypothetical protein
MTDYISMLEEESVALNDRFLRLSGTVHPESFSLVRAGLPDAAIAAECFFSDYAYADLKVPKRYGVIFRLAEDQAMEYFSVTIRAVTQQFGKPFEDVPHGWKTVIWLGPEVENSALLRSLPVLREWTTGTIGLASEATWNARTRTVG